VADRPDDGHNLDAFIDTTDTGFLGQCFDLPGLRRWLAEPHAGSPGPTIDW
jgi:hypothetical protein